MLSYHTKGKDKMETTLNMKAQFEAFLAENEKFNSGNAAAGTRARKALGELAKLCKARRNEITEEKNARKEAK
jgi:hypothetical protein